MYTPEDIKALRLKLGDTLEEFGRRLGVTRSTASYWESGGRHPRYEVLVKINELAKKAKRLPKPKSMPTVG